MTGFPPDFGTSLSLSLFAHLGKMRGLSHTLVFREGSQEHRKHCESSSLETKQLAKREPKNKIQAK